ncbi:uncharacterized protein LY79DRAFT_549260 [Colletotrichum navitas]|uniref:Uncharacterized protein n=1 Tax=Colletotrichum navitas TaxID=681940 RepID=A0AAD8Q3T3_9PEZI|nr:uncharacterized protein LY79DRAFT_549260 [Colletotrichum navitas]KAK1594626.1 hypothetical protein LY79DRAFT_549260 [Colletotrichum navitas]
MGGTPRKLPASMARRRPLSMHRRWRGGSASASGTWSERYGRTRPKGCADGQDRRGETGQRTHQVLQVFEERAPDRFGNVYHVVSEEELEDISRAYKKEAGFEIGGVNPKPGRLRVSAKDCG